MSFARLNDHSQQFLERGYLLPGVTVQERVREIAQAAENILNKE
jgi:ribonucleoside-diphosphate reductase alpha chain